MLDAGISTLASELISLREVIRLALLSALLVLVGTRLFGENAATRRIYWMCSGVLVVAAPWVLGGATWSLGMVDPPRWMLDLSLPAVFVWSWWAVAAILLLRLGVQVRRSLVELRHLSIATDVRCETLLHALCDALDVDTPVVRIGAGPCSSTLGRSTIALPEDYLNWSETTLRAVLSHELVHISRRDDRWMLALRLLGCWYWWIPWMTSLHNQFVRAMEESCDDLAAQLCFDKTAYLAGLADVAGRLSHESGAALAGLLGHHVVARISRFLSFRPQELDVAALYWTILVVVGGVLLVTSVQPVALPVALPSQSVPLAVRDQIPMAPRQGPQVAVHEVSSGSHDLVLDSPPIYPGRALEAGTEGEVLVSFVVTADGHTSRSHIVSGTPANVFDQAVLAAVRRLRYEPSYRRSSQLLAFTRGNDPPSNLRGAPIVRRYQFRVD